MLNLSQTLNAQRHPHPSSSEPQLSSCHRVLLSIKTKKSWESSRVMSCGRRHPCLSCSGSGWLSLSSLMSPRCRHCVELLCWVYHFSRSDTLLISRSVSFPIFIPHVDICLFAPQICRAVLIEEVQKVPMTPTCISTMTMMIWCGWWWWWWW